MKALLVAQDIRKEVGEGGRRTPIIDGISLTVHAGEKVALTGPSGSGKSTLLHILGALDPDYEGALTIDGRSLRQLDDVQRAALRNRFLGFIFQAYNLLGYLTVLQNVLLPARFSSAKPDAARALALLATVGLGDKGHRFPPTLSGGERQRVAIARALYQHPALVFCDEPTGNLDPDTAGEVIGLFERLRDDGVALLVATHDAAVAASADRVLHLHGAKIA